MSHDHAHANPVAERFDLVPWGGVVMAAQIMAEGIKTHAKDSWRRMPMEENIERAMRHLALYQIGDVSDDHIAHAVCRMLMAGDQLRAFREGSIGIHDGLDMELDDAFAKAVRR